MKKLLFVFCFLPCVAFTQTKDSPFYLFKTRTISYIKEGVNTKFEVAWVKQDSTLEVVFLPEMKVHAKYTLKYAGTTHDKLLVYDVISMNGKIFEGHTFTVSVENKTVLRKTPTQIVEFY